MSTPESMSIESNRAAIALAERLDYTRAVDQLHRSPAERRKQVSAPEMWLYLHTFKPKQKKAERTEEEKLLVRVFHLFVQMASSKTAPSDNSQASQNESRKCYLRATNGAASSAHKVRKGTSSIKRVVMMRKLTFFLARSAGETCRLPMAKVIADLDEVGNQLFPRLA